MNDNTKIMYVSNDPTKSKGKAKIQFSALLHFANNYITLFFLTALSLYCVGRHFQHVASLPMTITIFIVAVFFCVSGCVVVW